MNNEKLLKLLKEGKFNELELALIENIREDVVTKRNVKKSELNIIKRLVKTAKRSDNCVQHLCINGKEYYAFMTEHMALWSKESFEYTLSPNQFDLKSAITDDFLHEIEVDVNELRVFKKLNIEKEPFIIESGDFKIGVNPNLLLDAIDFCGTNTIKCTKSASPIFLFNNIDDKHGLVLPIRI